MTCEADPCPHAVCYRCFRRYCEVFRMVLAWLHWRDPLPVCTPCWEKLTSDQRWVYIRHSLARGGFVNEDEYADLRMKVLAGR